MTTTDHSRPGSAGGADRPGHLHGGPDDDYSPEQLAAMDRTELDRLGARYDGVEVLHVEPTAPPGSPLDRRNTRQVTLWFALAGIMAFTNEFGAKSTYASSTTTYAGRRNRRSNSS